MPNDNLDNDTIRVINDQTDEYIDLPTALFNDLNATLHLNDRAALNNFVNECRQYINNLPAVNDDHGTQVLYNDSPGYFQFQYIDNPALYDYNLDTGEYNVDCVTLNNYGIVADHHNGRGDHYRDWYIFDHNPFTCRNGCRPRPRTRPRRRIRPLRRPTVSGRPLTRPEGY